MPYFTRVTFSFSELPKKPPTTPPPPGSPIGIIVGTIVGVLLIVFAAIVFTRFVGTWILLKSSSKTLHHKTLEHLESGSKRREKLLPLSAASTVPFSVRLLVYFQSVISVSSL